MFVQNSIGKSWQAGCAELNRQKLAGWFCSQLVVWPVRLLSLFSLSLSPSSLLPAPSSLLPPSPSRLKSQVASKHGLSTQPRLVDIIAAVPPAYKKALLPKLKAKPVRTASGIAVVAVMCKPHRCPHITFTGNVCV